MTITPTQTRQSSSAFAFHRTESPTLSIVVPVHDEYGVLAELYRRVREVMEPSAGDLMTQPYNWEFQA